MAGSRVKPAWTLGFAPQQAGVTSGMAVTAGPQTVGGWPGPAGVAVAGLVCPLIVARLWLIFPANERNHARKRHEASPPRAKTLAAASP